jgi:hypothetical protein
MRRGDETMEIVEYAEHLGRHAADLFCDEFGVSPSDDVAAVTVGDWDSTAWTEDWIELVRYGATKEECDVCLAAWRKGFWS